MLIRHLAVCGHEVEGELVCISDVLMLSQCTDILKTYIVLQGIRFDAWPSSPSTPPSSMLCAALLAACNVYCVGLNLALSLSASFLVGAISFFVCFF